MGRYFEYIEYDPSIQNPTSQVLGLGKYSTPIAKQYDLHSALEDPKGKNQWRKHVINKLKPTALSIWNGLGLKYRKWERTMWSSTREWSRRLLSKRKVLVSVTKHVLRSAVSRASLLLCPWKNSNVLVRNMFSETTKGFWGHWFIKRKLLGERLGFLGMRRERI